MPFNINFMQEQELSRIKNSKVVGIILSYNCASFLEDIYNRIPQEVFDEIFVADDGSTDNSGEVAKKLGMPFFTHKHMGYGGNIKFGLKEAIARGAEYVVEIHGDGQYDLAFILPALKKISEGYDFLLGSRFSDFLQPLRDKMPYSRYFANIGLSFIDRVVLGVPLTEFHTGFRIYTRRLMETIDIANTSDDYLFSFEVIVQARYCGLKIGEIPIRCNYAGKHTSISIKKSVIYSFQTFRILFLYLMARLGFPSPLFHCRH